MIQLVGAPFDHCGRTHGSRLGPITVRLEGLEDTLRALGRSVTDAGNVIPVGSDRLERLEDRQAAGADFYGALRAQVGRILTSDGLPVVIGGDHSISIGSISAALAKHGDGLGVLWIDAHMDFNTPDTSPSGNIHGMPLAALVRLMPRDTHAPAYWEQILAETVPENALRPDATCWVGLRDVDDGEIANLARCPGPLAITMQDVDRLGVDGVVKRLIQWVEDAGVQHLWVSFDVDSLDPIYAPGTGTAVRGGLSYREAHFLAEALFDITQGRDAKCRLAGVDVVEVNPMRDNLDETAKVAVEWVASLFGKSILGPQSAGRTER